MSAVDLPEGFGEVEQPLQGYPPTPALDPDYGDVRPSFWVPDPDCQLMLGVWWKPSLTSSGCNIPLQRNQQELHSCCVPAAASP